MSSTATQMAYVIYYEISLQKALFNIEFRTVAFIVFNMT